ncbi:phosphate acetyltransferase [Schaalia georgiae F0490]|uniref:Phosphate acetyltransferase n=1 Tax=Schaalia georgiae F0490 TaxID=1125717 RepID=J1HJQ9_9ACTO|nr:phosphate acetyltransferase [Schaalia georgiae F0490]
MTSRYIVVGSGSHEAAALVLDQLATAFGASASVARVPAFAGTDADSAAVGVPSALPDAVGAVRERTADVVLIESSSACTNRSFDALGWDFSLAASVGAGVVLAPDTEGVGAELLAQEAVTAVSRAADHQAVVMALALPAALVGRIDSPVPVLPLPVDGEGLAALASAPAPSAVTPLAFQADLVERARADRKRIVLPEPDDDRVLRAAAQVLASGIADITFVGDADYVAKRAGELGLDLGAAQVVSTGDPAYLERYAEEFARLRAKKGVTLEQARDKVADVSYFGTMMVHMGDADGMVSGAAHTTAHTIVPSFQIIKTAPGVSVVSSIFLMLMKDRVWAFGDCAVNPNPTPEQLADIAVTSARTAAQFGVAPRVAMLSYSTGSSGSGPDVDAVAEATRLAREKAPELAIEGPIQFDAAVDSAVAEKKLPGSEVAGRATVFVFPSLEAGNIGYKAVQRSSGAVAVGPVLQGLNKPVNDLSRGALVEDIVNTVALTAIQAQG